MVARLSRPAFRVQPARVVSAISIRTFFRGAAFAGAGGARLPGHGERACGQPGRGGGSVGILKSEQRRATAGSRAVERQSPQLVFLHHRRRVYCTRNSQSDRAAQQTPRFGVLSRADRAGTPGVVGAGGEPELPLAACRHVRWPRALLDLPGAGDEWRGVLSARGQRRAGHAQPHRRRAGRSPRLPIAAAGRYLGRAAGSHRASALPGRSRRKRGCERIVVAPFMRLPNKRADAVRTRHSCSVPPEARMALPTPSTYSVST